MRGPVVEVGPEEEDEKREEGRFTVNAKGVEELGDGVGGLTTD